MCVQRAQKEKETFTYLAIVCVCIHATWLGEILKVFLESNSPIVSFFYNSVYNDTWWGNTHRSKFGQMFC